MSDARIAIPQPWPAPPPVVSLDYGEVHVWRAELDLPGGQVNGLRRYLAGDELEKAAKFYFEKDRARYTVAHGLLRLILSRYTHREPGGLDFCLTPYGKPALAGEPLRFNLSHSHGLALVAVTRHQEIGVDLEWIRDNLEVEQIACRFFSPREAAMLRELPAPLRNEAFFRCWTLKEAYIKALGKGLSLPLDRFTVSFAPNAAKPLLEIDSDAEGFSHCDLALLAPGPGYVAAVAVEGEISRLNCWTAGSEIDTL
ncbi:MAG TPA: 4'-phosphopantetheinyl transferase superfamily protein [Chloroflexia bacterium]|nr:4'-phosphopantetheinyl transferase superfamily protein [Chloroflexia bacterium]